MKENIPKQAGSERGEGAEACSREEAEEHVVAQRAVERGGSRGCLGAARRTPPVPHGVDATPQRRLRGLGSVERNPQRGIRVTVLRHMAEQFVQHYPHTLTIFRSQAPEESLSKPVGHEALAQPDETRQTWQQTFAQGK